MWYRDISLHCCSVTVKVNFNQLVNKLIYFEKMSYLSESHKIEILMMIGYGDRSRTQLEVVHLFRQKYPDLPPISQGTVSKIERRFLEVGHVRDVPRQRPSKIDENTQLNVLLAMEENPVTAARRVARVNSIHHKSVLKILKSANKRPYKMQPVQELLEDDADRRVQFCELMMNAIDENRISSEWILFSDEATFTLNGHVNKQNCRYWSDENPHWVRETNTQYPEKTNVWAGIIGRQVIGPIFFDDTLTGERYLEFLEHELVPALRALYPSQLDPDLYDERIWMQQDGAPPHYARNVRQYLDDNFPNRWIGRRGAIEWPARSPDLTPLDFFLWGHLKSQIYVSKPENVEELKERIRQEIRQISPEVLENVRNEFYYRLGLCQQVNGAHFEHLIH